MKKVFKIVITGGPCGGKTTALEEIKKHFDSLGYHVLTSSEAATELITGGVAPWTLYSNYEFQKALIKLQQAKEKILLKSAQQVKDSNTIILVCDRGIMDNHTYLSDNDFVELMKINHLNEAVVGDTYDGIFHLVTAANGAEKFYTTENNSARIEAPEVAIDADNRSIRSWMGHENFRVIDNSTDFENKIKRLLNQITDIIEEKNMEDGVNKFLIDLPNVDVLKEKLITREVEIKKHTFISKDGKETKILERIVGGTSLFKIVKKDKNGKCKKTTISEKRIGKISKEKDIKETVSGFKKLCFVYKSKYYEIDFFKNLGNKAILKRFKQGKNEKVELPPFISNAVDVTGDKSYCCCKMI